MESSGFQSALEIATNAIDCIHTTAASHGRVFIVEIMGHKVGSLTLNAGVAGGADVILIPEIPYDINKVAEAIQKRNKAGKRFTILAVAEGAISKEDAELPKKKYKEKLAERAKKYPSVSYEIADQIQQVTGSEVRITVPGHMQRGGGNYYNFSGCGNTLNCNHPIVRQMILECLRYWTINYRVDGFRFDLASILGRHEDGSPLNNPPLLELLAYDSVLRNVKLIAEAWDAGGLYQVGSFPASRRWAEWNGRYRDCLRSFLKGDFWNAWDAAWSISGSGDLYGGFYSDHSDNYAGYNSCVNFLTCHDGFTMYDLYSYNEKHNEANGWNNTDGSKDNRSWNLECFRNMRLSWDLTVKQVLRFRRLLRRFLIRMQFLLISDRVPTCLRPASLQDMLQR